MHTVVKLFEQQVEEFQESIAVKSDIDTLTYRELNIQANRIADVILSDAIIKALNAERVALLFEHGTDMIKGILGVLKAGKVYVALDPEYPHKRLNYILEDSGSCILLTNNAKLELAIALKNESKNEIHIVNIDRLALNLSEKNPCCEIELGQAAYIMYTSGSTGNPKGVVQSHQNISNFTGAFSNEMNINPSDRIALFTSYSHTVSVIDIFSCLICGAAIYPYNIKSEGSMEKLSEWLTEEGITIFHSVPTVFRYLMDAIPDDMEFDQITLIILGGESVYKKDIERYKEHFSKDSIFVNLFGSSEVLIGTSYVVDQETDLSGDTVPLGYAVEGVKIYLLNEKEEEVGIYGIGEIVYKSEYLAIGYWNMEEKTNEMFVKDFITGEGRVFKSGDLGRLLPDGSIEYIGRKDFQIKINGNRVEPDEIEAIISGMVGIRNCVVTVIKKEEDQNYLAAYYVVKDKMELEVGYIKQMLQNKLPDYMVPTYFIPLKELPLTPNGKIDRCRLPQAYENNSERAFEEPRNDIERILQKIWKEVLGIERIGINDSFFELGGHSLKATSLVSKMHKELNIKIPFKQVFHTPSIKEIASYIKGLEENKYSSIKTTEKKDYYNISSAQKMMYILKQIEGNNTSYNVPMALTINGDLDRVRLEAAFISLIERHETLRTSFELVKMTPVQIIQPRVDFKLAYFEEEEANITYIINDFIRPFDLNKAPLFRGALIKVTEFKHVLLLDMHHIITDGTSVGVMVREISALYNGENLPELKLQYKDFSEWQSEILHTEGMKKQEQYWLNMFQDCIPLLDMPVDFNRPEVQTFNGTRIKLMIPSEIVGRMENLVKEYRTTLNVLTFCIYSVLINKYSGQDDLVVGTTVAARTHNDLENIIGMFVNFLPVRSKIDVDSTFKEYLLGLNELLMDCYENQEYPFDMMVEKMGNRLDRTRNPLFDTMLIFHSQFESIKTFQANGVIFSEYEIENETSKLDLKMDIYAANEGGFECWLEYNTDLFKEGSMQNLLRHFRMILEQVLNNMDLKLSEIKVFTPKGQQRIEEKRQLIKKNHDLSKARKYWKDYLRGYDQKADFPKYKIPEIRDNVKYDQYEFTVEKKYINKLVEGKNENSLDFNAVFQTIWGVVLKKYNMTDDVVFGYALPKAQLEMNNTAEKNELYTPIIPVRLKLDQTTRFIDAAKALEQQNNYSKAYKNISLKEIQAFSEMEEELLSNIVCVEEFHQDHCDLSVLPIVNKDLVVKITYNNLIYQKDIIRLIADCLKMAICAVGENPHILLQDIEILSEVEKRKQLVDFNNTKAAYPYHQTIHMLFEEQVDNTPDNIAISFEDKLLTYRELNHKSNQLARLLRDKGVGPDCVVGILANRSIEMIIVMLAILKAGGAYLPLDPQYPPDRIKFMLEDSGTRILLAHSEISEHIQYSGNIIHFDDALIYSEDGSNLENINNPNDMAYVIYTSGTTGIPKGVMIEHKNVVRLMFNSEMQFDFNESDVWSMFHSYCFDFSVWEMYGALLYGGKLVIVPKHVAKDTGEYVKLLKNTGVTILNQTPTAFYNLSNEEEKSTESNLKVRYVIFGGEALKPILLKSWNKKYPYCKLINMYGITETTVHVTYKQITSTEIESNISNIGKPIPTMTTYVLGCNMELLPIGAAGELYVGGAGLGRGYLNRLELTKEKFLNHPITGERLYKSGDLARLLPNGEMEYLGRIDHQVKIRGHRIELGEIENQLLKIDVIKEIIVLAKEDNDQNVFLCAYYVSLCELTVVEIKEKLKRVLPEYMVPAYFIRLDYIPMTSNGKVNRNKLPEIGGNINTGLERVLPRNETENKLAHLWKEVLGINVISVTDSFFDLGGDSIKVINLVNRMNELIQINVRIQDIYMNQSIKELVTLIEKNAKNISDMSSTLLY
ncbi:MAG: hypothetical protein CVV02_12595 [Firmicutes bacterium HGW-Firmicutes-7]|nr:MAG: hypothetical protein CVV02_12595 [Firmicutes bacterium HGW-Firmicutes-7]